MVMSLPIIHQPRLNPTSHLLANNIMIKITITFIILLLFCINLLCNYLIMRYSRFYSTSIFSESIKCWLSGGMNMCSELRTSSAQVAKYLMTFIVIVSGSEHSITFKDTWQGIANDHNRCCKRTNISPPKSYVVRLSPCKVDHAFESSTMIKVITMQNQWPSSSLWKLRVPIPSSWYHFD